MNKRLNDYLDSMGAKPLDERISKAYQKSMETTIPLIEKQMRENAQRAAEIRFSPWPVAPRRKPGRGKKDKRE